MTGYLVSSADGSPPPEPRRSRLRRILDEQPQARSRIGRAVAILLGTTLVAIAAIGARAGVAFTGLWLEASAETMRGRIASRIGDVSDATTSVLDEQLGYYLGQQSFAMVDAGRRLDEVVASSLELISSQRRRR